MYLLSKKEAARLPQAAHFVARAHAEELALERYGSVEALMEAKRKQRQIEQAEFEYKKAMHDAKVKAAKAHGLRPPNHMHTPHHLSQPVTLDWNLVGNPAREWGNPWKDVLAPVPFPSKNDPTSNAVIGGVANRVYTCSYCRAQLTRWESDKALRRYPSAVTCTREHDCPHRQG
jgi:hypothetical protein